MSNNHYRSVSSPKVAAAGRFMLQALECAAVLAVLLAVFCAACALPGYLDHVSASWDNIGG